MLVVLMCDCSLYVSQSLRCKVLYKSQTVRSHSLALATYLLQTDLDSQGWGVELNTPMLVQYSCTNTTQAILV